MFCMRLIRLERASGSAQGGARRFPEEADYSVLLSNNTTLQVFPKSLFCRIDGIDVCLAHAQKRRDVLRAERIVRGELAVTTIDFRHGCAGRPNQVHATRGN